MRAGTAPLVTAFSMWCRISAITPASGAGGRRLLHGDNQAPAAPDLEPREVALDGVFGLGDRGADDGQLLVVVTSLSACPAPCRCGGLVEEVGALVDVKERVEDGRAQLFSREAPGGAVLGPVALTGKARVVAVPIAVVDGRGTDEVLAAPGYKRRDRPGGTARSPRRVSSSPRPARNAEPGRGRRACRRRDARGDRRRGSRGRRPCPRRPGCAARGGRPCGSRACRPGCGARASFSHTASARAPSLSGAKRPKRTGTSGAWGGRGEVPGRGMDVVAEGPRDPPHQPPRAPFRSMPRFWNCRSRDPTGRSPASMAVCQRVRRPDW